MTLHFREPLPVIRGKRRIVTMIYTLEPMRAGELTVAPVAISFTDSRADGDGREHTIETEALTLTVTTVLDAEAPTLDDLRGSSGPLEIPRQLGGALWWIATTAAVVAGIAGFAWWRFRRRLVIATPELTPRERAFLELQQLIDARLAETDIKGYYVALTGVVRRYIERTTLVRAPEQTTDEFLREIADHPAFTLDERRRLQSFLLAADLVKYAAHEPSGQDLEQSFERAKEFLGLSSHASTEAAA